MKYEKPYQMLRVTINDKEREQAKELAKERGMTFSGFMGNLVKEELRRVERTQKREGV